MSFSSTQKSVVGVVHSTLMQATFEPILKQITRANCRKLPSDLIRFWPTKEIKDTHVLWKLQQRAVFELEKLHVDRENYVIATWKTDKDLLEYLGSSAPTSEVVQVTDASVLDLSVLKHAVLSLEHMQVDYCKIQSGEVWVPVTVDGDEKVLSGIKEQLTIVNSFEGPGAFPIFYDRDAKHAKEIRVSNVFRRGAHIVVEWETRDKLKGECISFTVLPGVELDCKKFASDWLRVGYYV